MSATEWGRAGEDAAVALLCQGSYEILARNYHSRFGEVDIIARKGAVIAFVEVKTRSQNGLGAPAMAVTLSKQQKIVKTAQKYFFDHPLDLQPRFDIVEVFTRSSKDPAVVKIRHIEGAFDCNGTHPFY